MTAIATVADVGLATVQDAGRFGWADAGVPVSGAWHGERYRAAIALAAGTAPRGDEASANAVPAIEVIAGELVLRMAADTAVAVVGPARVRVDGSEASAGTLHAANEGSRWSVVPMGRGPAYVVLAGWQAPRILGSAATDTFSGLGAPLARGDVLAGEPDPGCQEQVGSFLRAVAEHAGRAPLRVVASDDDLLGDVTAREWSVASVARSGVRLEATAPWRPEVTATSASVPLLPGTVQVTPAGEAIVLGPDGGLTGGYAVAGVMATVDLDRVSMLVPGDRVRLQPIDVANAQAAFARRTAAQVIRPHRLP